MKHSKLKTGIMIVLSLFFLLSFGSCSSSNDSIGTDTPVNPKPSDVKVMDKSKIVDYNKYHCPAKWNEGFEKGKTYTIKPTMVYNKGGKLHKAVITIKMKY